MSKSAVGASPYHMHTTTGNHMIDAYIQILQLTLKIVILVPPSCEEISLHTLTIVNAETVTPQC